MTKVPAWEEGFLKALGETGIAAQAARAVGITPRAAAKRRETNPTFAAAWAAAAALHRAEAARRAMSAADALVVDRHAGGKLARAGQTRWSRRAEEAFLTALAVSANVARAAAAAGFSKSALYARRRKDPHFAEAWQAAVADGRMRIDAYLVEAADHTFDPACAAADVDMPKVSIAEAIKIAQLGQAKAARTAAQPSRPAGGWTGPADWDDPDDEEAVAQARENIINRLERMRERDEEEKVAAGWTRVEVPGTDENRDEHERWTWIPPGYGRVAG